MKKTLLPLLLSLTLTGSVFGQAANAVWGTAAAAGGALFFDASGAGLSEISLGYFAGGDTSGAFTSVASHTYTAGPPAGFLNASTALTGITYSGETAWLRLGDSTSTSYVTDSSWATFSGTTAPAAPSTYNISIGSSTSAADLTLINAVAVDGGGFTGSGVSISVVPEPSTYALIAGFAAFLFAAIRRRK